MGATPKLRPGDRTRLSAEFLNKLIDLTNSSRGQLTSLLSANSQPHVILVKNTSGGFVEASGILGIGDSVLEPGTADSDTEMNFRFQRPIFKGDTPHTENHKYKFCILREGLGSNDVGEAYAFIGLAVTKIDIQDTDHEYAHPQAENTEELITDIDGGAKIIWSATGEDSGGLGTAWALVQFIHEEPEGSFDRPEEVGSQDEDETAMTDFWVRSDPGEDSAGPHEGLELTAITRMAYKHDSDKKLYAYYRVWTFDTSGKLALVSKEYRVEIDAAEAC